MTARSESSGMVSAATADETVRQSARSALALSHNLDVDCHAFGQRGNLNG
jgi:hypothetical protein